jgi:hypothetical protein
MGILDDLSKAAGVLRKADKIKEYKIILQAQEKLIDYQKRNSQLESENRTLKEKLEIKEDLIFEKNAYWVNRNQLKEGPYCTLCWDDEKKLVRLREGDYIGGWALCPKCKSLAPR